MKHWVITLHVKDTETKSSLRYTLEELESEVRRVIGCELLLGIDSLEVTQTEGTHYLSIEHIDHLKEGGRVAIPTGTRMLALTAAALEHVEGEDL